MQQISSLVALNPRSGLVQAQILTLYSASNPKLSMGSGWKVTDPVSKPTLKHTNNLPDEIFVGGKKNKNIYTHTHTSVLYIAEGIKSSCCKNLI